MDPEAVKKQISDLLNQDVSIPERHRGGLVTFVNLNKIDIALATKVVEKDKFQWNVELIGEHNWTGDNSLGVLNKITW